MTYPQNITPEDSSAIELTPNGTIQNIIDLTIHTGTYMRLREGTWADYHSQELAQDTMGQTSMDVLAIDGEWKICESNENNLFVTDVASFPLARCAQYCGSDNNATYNLLEFPHHHYAPRNLSGTVSTQYTTSNPIYGLVTRGDYVFFVEYINANEWNMLRVNILTGAVNTLSEGDLNLMGYGFGDLEFVAIDNDMVMITLQDADHYGTFRKWATYNFPTSELRIVCQPSDVVYFWHWAVIGTKLCISGWGYYFTAPNNYQDVKYHNYIYDYTTGNLLVGSITTKYRPGNNMQYPVCNDLIVGKKYFVQYQTGCNDPSYRNRDDRPRLFIFDVEANTIRVVYPIYNAGYDVVGYNYMYHLCESPFDHLMYYISYHTQSSPYTPANCFSIQDLYPSNYSNGTRYEYINLDGAANTDYSKVPAVLVPGMWELYVIMGNGDVYNVRELPGALGSPIFTMPQLWEVPVGLGNQPYYDNIDKPQPDKIASCLDRWDRLWYIDGSYVNAVNIKTGVVEININAGIPYVYRNQSCGYYNYSFQHVHLATDRVFVLSRSTGYCGHSTFSTIHKIE